LPYKFTNIFIYIILDTCPSLLPFKYNSFCKWSSRSTAQSSRFPCHVFATYFWYFPPDHNSALIFYLLSCIACPMLCNSTMLLIATDSIKYYWNSLLNADTIIMIIFAMSPDPSTAVLIIYMRWRVLCCETRKQGSMSMVWALQGVIFDIGYQWCDFREFYLLE